MFTIGEAPSGSEPVCKVVTRLTIGDLIGQCNNALPLGNQAMIKLGGVETVFGAKKDNGGFPDEQIVIPVGVTPQNLKSFTLYDILGFGSMADSVDTDAIKKAYHKAVLMYHPDKAQYKLANGEEDRSVFLKIQEAFAVLTNDDKRRYSLTHLLTHSPNHLLTHSEHMIHNYHSMKLYLTKTKLELRWKRKDQFDFSSILILSSSVMLDLLLKSLSQN